MSHDGSLHKTLLKVSSRVDLPMSKITEVGGKVDVARDEDDGRQAAVEVSKPADTLTQLLVGCVLALRTYVDQVYLQQQVPSD